MMAGAKLPAPRTANELLGADFGSVLQHPDRNDEEVVRESCWTGPVLIAQGVLDPLNDAADRLQRYQGLRAGIQGDAIAAGHCPHDELPTEVAQSMARWMSARSTSTAAVSAPSSKTVAL